MGFTNPRQLMQQLADATDACFNNFATACRNVWYAHTSRIVISRKHTLYKLLPKQETSWYATAALITYAQWACWCSCSGVRMSGGSGKHFERMSLRFLHLVCSQIPANLQCQVPGSAESRPFLLVALTSFTKHKDLHCSLKELRQKNTALTHSVLGSL